jgi:hypothetical protein
MIPHTQVVNGVRETVGVETITASSTVNGKTQSVSLDMPARPSKVKG